MVLFHTRYLNTNNSQAKQLLSSKAIECGIQPSSNSFLALFSYYTNKGTWDEAISILGHMCRQELMPGQMYFLPLAWPSALCHN